MASFGAVSFGATAPQGYLQESSKDVTKEVTTIRNADGQIVIAEPKPRTMQVISVTTKGESNLLSVPEGNFSGATLTEAKITQSNDDFSTSEATYTQLY